MCTDMTKEISIVAPFDGQSQHGSFPQHMWHRFRWWVILRSLFCIAGICFGAFILEPGTKMGLLGGVLVTAGSLGFMRPMLWQMWQERGLRKHPAYDTTVHYTFSEVGVKMSGEIGDAEVPWSEFYELVPTKKGLLIYQDKKQYLWIAKSSFKGEQMQEVVSLFAAAS